MCRYPELKLKKLVVLFALALVFFNSYSSPPKVILFDTFVTVADWRGSMIQTLNQHISQLNQTTIDTAQFADDWAAAYADGIERINNGITSFTTVDALNEAAIQLLLKKYGIAEKITPKAREEISFAWHKLEPWPDAVSGIESLKKIIW